jgi:hypothetical protein
MQVVLEAIAGPYRGSKTVVGAGQSAKLGRTDRADFAFPLDQQMSGLHFAIRSTPRGFEISDLGSTNGTLLNGESLAAAVLRDGDEILAGQSRFKVRLEGRAILAASESQRTESGLPFLTGLSDPDPRVRREALFAAVWSRQSWLLAHCRKLAENPTAEHWDAILMLAILGKPAELSRIAAVSRADALSPRRYLACGAFGHPALVESLLQVMAGNDAPCAAIAGLAFEKIVGVDIGSSRRTAVILDEGGPPSDVRLPDVDKAIAHWSQVQAKYSASTRVCRGIDLSGGISEEILAEMDMESRWEVRLRLRYDGALRGSLSEWERSSCR